MVASATTSIALVAALSQLGGVSGKQVASESAAARPADCGRSSGPFNVVRGKVVDGAGKPYVPYGVSTAGLTNPLWAGSSKYLGTIDSEKAQVDAAATAWCSNTIRLQVSQDVLIDGEGFDPAALSVNEPFLAGVRTVVEHARSKGLVVVLSLQAAKDDQPEVHHVMMTERSMFFWRAMAKEFGTDEGIVFDLFNEPRRVDWKQWRDGYTDATNGVRYYGFEPFARKLRARGVENLFWVQGKSTATTLEGMPLLRNVKDVAYVFHHPPLPQPGQSWRQAWQASFGYLVDQGVPVVAGEWAQYSDSAMRNEGDGSGACWPDAATSVPAFLKYAADKGTGVVAYKPHPGVLNVAETLGRDFDYTRPNQIDAATWECDPGSLRSAGQGAGDLLQQWFREQNGPRTAATGRWSYLGRRGAKDTRARRIEGTDKRVVAGTNVLHRTGQMRPDVRMDAVRRWTASTPGEVTVRVAAADENDRCRARLRPNGVTVTVLHQGTRLWHKVVPDGPVTRTTRTMPPLALRVRAGEVIDVVVHANGDHHCDRTAIDVSVGPAS